MTSENFMMMNIVFIVRHFEVNGVKNVKIHLKGAQR